MTAAAPDADSAATAPRLYLDAMDLGNLTGGVYDAQADGDAIGWLATRLEDASATLVISPLHLYELRRAPQATRERMPALVRRVPTEILLGLPHQILDAELLAAVGVLRGSNCRSRWRPTP